MRHLRLGILISGGGRTMENIAAAIERGELDATIACVIASNAQCAGIEKARRLNLPVLVIARRASATLQEFSGKIAMALREYQVDLVLMAGFLSLWEIPADYQGRVMNIHPALLPKFGGKGMHGEAVHAAVLAAGEPESGCTVHFANNTYDAGPVILQLRVTVAKEDTVESLAKRVFEQECLAYPEAIRKFGENQL